MTAVNENKNTQAFYWLLGLWEKLEEKIGWLFQLNFIFTH